MHRTLRDYAQIHYGKSPNAVRDEHGIFPMYGTGGITGRAQKALFQESAIIVGRKGTLGNPILVDEPFWAIDTTYAVLPVNGTDLQWLFYNLKNTDLESLNEATGVPSISRDALYKLKFLDVEQTIQQGISARLAKCDELITNTESLISKYQSIKQGMMNDLFTRGVDENGELRPPYEEAPELYKKSELGWVPKEWEIVNLSELASVIDAQPDHRTPPEVAGGAPYVGMTEIDKRGGVDLAKARTVSREALEKQIRSFDIYPHAFMFGKIGTIGNPTKLPTTRNYCISANVVLITSPHDCHAQFVFHAIQANSTMRQVDFITNSTSQPALGIQTVRKLRIMRPPDHEMLKICAKLDQVNSYLSLNDDMRTKLNMLKQGLMHDLLTGKVRVPLTQSNQKAA